MDLQALLKKTENRSAKIKGTRTAPSIATEERPYTNDLNSAAAPASAITTPKEVGTKSEQTQTEGRLNLEQSQNKQGTKSEQTQNEARAIPVGTNLPLPQSQNKVGSQPRTEPRTKSEQTQNKVGTKPSFSSVVGLQRRIILFIFEATKTSRDKLTAPIAIQNLAETCQTTSMAAQVTTRRLEKKGLLIRAEYKDGRGGWTRYELPNDLFQELLQLETQNKLGTNPEQTWNKVGSQPRTEPRTSGSSSSSFLDSENFKTTTTGDPELFDDGRVQLSPDWAGVDFSPLADVGFSRAHLVQLAKHGKLSTAEVQDSIHFFAFDLKQNGKGRELKGPPVNFFMGILRKGLPYAPPENYESPEQAARREYLEGKRRLEERRQAEDRELQDLEFSAWRRGLSHEEMSAIVPDVVRHIPKAQESSLRAHFDENVWPARRAAVPGLIERERAEIGKQIDQALGEATG